jgi:hypothetical protein
MRPFLRRLPGDGKGEPAYALYYESYRPLGLIMTALPLKPRWKSSIAMSMSPDLGTWRRGRTLVEPNLAWTRAEGLGRSVSNPCLVADPEGGWRLYYSASLSWIEDCGFCEPRYIAVARGDTAQGPFIPEKLPIIDPWRDEGSPVPASPLAQAEPEPGEGPLARGLRLLRKGGKVESLGAGSMKVLAFEDGWIGLQNRIYRDGAGSSRSAIFILASEDGLSWKQAREEPLLAPTAGWMSSHVYACDCRFREADGRWYLYFNARDGWRIRAGRERIGRIVGA